MNTIYHKEFAKVGALDALKKPTKSQTTTFLVLKKENERVSNSLSGFGSMRIITGGFCYLINRNGKIVLKYKSRSLA